MRGLIEEAQLPTARLRDYGYHTLLLEVEGLSSSERNAEIIASRLVEGSPWGTLTIKKPHAMHFMSSWMGFLTTRVRQQMT